MQLNQLANKDGARKARKRVGRGPGSGKGRTAGRGMKGQNSRSGVSLLGFEGGQMPLYRRLPKRGFKNPTRLRFAEVNLGRLQAAIDTKQLDAGKTIDAAALVGAGLVRRVRDGVRLLAKGELKTKVTIEAVGASKAAAAAVEKAGGKIVAPVAAKPTKDGKAGKTAKRGQKPAAASKGKDAAKTGGEGQESK